ncbi:hypothetical protein BDQ12DRAFT_722331 [Crucibulum laeve]|uniref:N-acetyltransferase domain-containing protein n=1 Tax=Crucibulum laeve TaxID=68775 RepID=A0A5C3M3P6_9AGAR|nr:hypothetical protein BDQ12DRAFT_722331 [Crucibulum laeve]
MFFESILVQGGCRSPSGDDLSFDELFDNLLPQYLQTRAKLQEEATQLDENGNKLRLLTRLEVSALLNDLPTSVEDTTSVSELIAIRKLGLDRERRRAMEHGRSMGTTGGPVTPLSQPPSPSPVNLQVLDALNGLKTTPFENSFASRLQGTRAINLPGLIAVDWETITPWMDLMNDVRDHYKLAHADREQPMESRAPITYTSLQAGHLPQIHDLLERVFWSGIDVSDALEYWPEQCTVVAIYKKLVVGIAILSSPRETYITYLAVKAGWDKSQIASRLFDPVESRTMLYHLITLNPNKDITLHVSTNSSAMLLYNRFGFKAEEFVAGFYDNYLDPISRSSKNAFRLRLRQQ